jgi:hypothetical protein
MPTEKEWIELGRRAIACKAWRWMPGMRCTHRWTGGIRVLADEDGEQSEAYVVLPDADGNAVMTIGECGIMGGFPTLVARIRSSPTSPTRRRWAVCWRWCEMRGTTPALVCGMTGEPGGGVGWRVAASIAYTAQRMKTAMRRRRKLSWRRSKKGALDSMTKHKQNEKKAGTCPACGQCLRLSSRGRILGHSEQTNGVPKTCKGSGDAPVEAEEHAALEVAG